MPLYFPFSQKGGGEGFLLLALISGLIREGQYDSTLFFSLDCFTMSQDDGEHRIFPTQPILGLTIRNTQRLCLCSFPLVALRSPLFFVVDSLRRLSVSVYKMCVALRVVNHLFPSPYSAHQIRDSQPHQFVSTFW